MKKIYLSFIFFISSALLFGQTGIYTENDIKRQDLLIAAKKEILLGNVDKAIEVYKDLLEKYNEPAAAYELSRIFQTNDEFNEAEAYAQRAYEADNGNEWYLIQYTDLLTINENHLKAAELFKNFIKTHPNNDYYYLKASYHFLMAENTKEAIQILDHLEKINGINESTSQRKFEIYDVIGKEKDALKELEKLSETFPDDTKYLHNIAGYLRIMGKDRDANKIMDKILEIDPNDETALLFANSSTKNKDANYIKSLVPIIRDDRIGLDKKILELIPYLEEFASKNNPELGQSLLDIVLILDVEYPNNAKVKAIFGDIYFYSKKWDESVANYRSSLNLDKSVWSVWNQLFIALNITEDFEILQEISEEAMDIYPNQAVAYMYNGLANLENGNSTEAEMSVREAVMIGGSNPLIKAEANFLLSKIRSDNKLFTESLELINKSLATDDGNPHYLEQLGDVLYAKGDVKEAKDAWKEAIKAGGNPDRIEKKITGENTLDN